MIQFNLLPEVKIAFIKAERQKRLVLFVSFVASAAAIAVFVLLFSFTNGVQKKSINDLSTDITNKNKTLMETKDLDKVLTIQNQLGSLDTLHQQKIISSRLFPYLEKLTPAQTTITQLDIDFTANTLSVSGEATSLTDINTFADAFKFTKYAMKSTPDKQENAFKDVVLSSISREDDVTKYTITASFVPEIFAQAADPADDVALVVPQMVTTRSSTERPKALFQEETKASGE